MALLSIIGEIIYCGIILVVLGAAAYAAILAYIKLIRFLKN